MAIHCGDPVSQKIAFSGFPQAQGDTQALVILTRDPDEPVKNFVLDVKNQEVEVKWPDLDKGADDYWGGAKAYLDVPGSRQQKWAKQKYFFEVIVGNYTKKSSTITLDPLPDKGQVTKRPVVPCILYNRTIGGVLDVFGVSKLPKLINPNPDQFNAGMGKFDIEFTKGEVLIKLAVQLTPRSSWVPKNIFDRFKKTAEGFWNGPNGFGGFALHHKKCVRDKKCDCKVAYDKQANVVSGGCCKIPIRLEIENGSRHGLTFEVAYRGPFSVFSGAWAPDPGPPAQLGRISYPEGGSNTWAHEVGHCLGFPDQYLGGHLWDNHPQGKFPKKYRSIMGGGQGRADEDHLIYVNDYMGGDFTNMRETINR